MKMAAQRQDADIAHVINILSGAELSDSRPGPSNSRPHPGNAAPAKPGRPAQRKKQKGVHSAPAAHNLPGIKSHGASWHCDVCGAWVPAAQLQWDTHVSGIKHRRNVLSLRDHGRRGVPVHSVFEPGPGSSSAAPPTSSSAAPFTPPHDAPITQTARAAGRALRKEALIQVINNFGAASHTVSQAYPLITEDSLAAMLMCWRQLLQEGTDTWRISTTYAAHGLLLGYMALKDGISRPIIRVELWKRHLTTTGQVSVILSALCMLLDALATRPGGVKLLSITFQDGVAPYLVDLFSQGMWHVVQGARRMLETNLTLLELQLNVVSAAPAAESEYAIALGEILAEAKPVLEQARATAADNMLHTLLLATHPRCGCHSRLRDLPLPLFMDLVGQVLPQGKTCLVTVNQTYNVP